MVVEWWLNVVEWWWVARFVAVQFISVQLHAFACGLKAGADLFANSLLNAAKFGLDASYIHRSATAGSHRNINMHVRLPTYCQHPVPIRRMLFDTKWIVNQVAISR